MSHDPYFVCGEDEKAYIADFVRSPIASTFMPGSMFSVLSLYRYRSQYRPNTCVRVAFTRHDQVHMYLYNVYRPIYRPLYLYIYYIGLTI